MALESLFIGAEKVRAKKHTNTISKNIHRKFEARIASQMWEAEKRKLKVI